MTEEEINQIPAWKCSKCNAILSRTGPSMLPDRTFNTKGEYFCKCTRQPITERFPLYWKLRN